ncbi:hypothetical protein Lser_V15G28947 [Lactuca serriola]
MSSSDSNGLLRSSGNVFPSEEDLPHVNEGERMLPSSSNGGTGNHASPNFPPPPPLELAIDLVLRSLPESYCQFIKDYYMRDDDMTLIDLTYMLIVVEVEMIKSTSQEKMFEGSVSKISMNIDNGNIVSPEKVSLPNGKGSAKVKPFDHMVKRKTNYEIVPCANPKSSMCFYCQLKGHWMRSCPN